MQIGLNGEYDCNTKAIEYAEAIYLWHVPLRCVVSVVLQARAYSMVLEWQEWPARLTQQVQRRQGIAREVLNNVSGRHGKAAGLTFI